MRIEESKEGYTLNISPEFERILDKVKKFDSELLARLEKQLVKILRNPNFGKPIRNVLRNYRRAHVDSHVLIYEVSGNQVRLIDFDHHDRVYKKYS